MPGEGRYRIQMKACAVGGGGKAIPVGFLTVENGPEEPVLKEMHEIQPGEPKVYEFEFDLARRQQFVVNLLTLWDIRTFKKPIEEWDGLGLQVDWLKIEGPLGEFPPPSYAKVCDGVPLEYRSVVQARAAGKKPPTIKEPRNEYQWANDPLVPTSEHPKEDAERLPERLGHASLPRPQGPLVWLHGASVGESLSLLPLISPACISEAPRAEPTLLQRIAEGGDELDDIARDHWTVMEFFRNVRIATGCYAARASTPCIGIYTAKSRGAVRVIGSTDPRVVYSRPLTLEVGDGTNGCFPLCGPLTKSIGNEAVIQWRRMHDADALDRDVSAAREQFEALEVEQLTLQRTKRRSKTRDA